MAYKGHETTLPFAGHSACTKVTPTFFISPNIVLLQVVHDVPFLHLVQFVYAFALRWYTNCFFLEWVLKSVHNIIVSKDKT